MIIICGDFVRPNNPAIDLPRNSVWSVIGTIGGLNLNPENPAAFATRHFVTGIRFKPEDFEKVIPSGTGWVPVPPKSPVMPADSVPNEALTGRMPSIPPSLQYLPKIRFEEQIAIRQSEIKSLRRAAKERAEKDAALAAELAIIKAEQERAQKRDALLYADRELARATTALLDEIYRMNRGGANQPAAPVVSRHADELQPLARRHGYKLAAAGTLHVLTAL